MRITGQSGSIQHHPEELARALAERSWRITGSALAAYELPHVIVRDMPPAAPPAAPHRLRWNGKR